MVESGRLRRLGCLGRRRRCGRAHSRLFGHPGRQLAPNIPKHIRHSRHSFPSALISSSRARDQNEYHTSVAAPPFTTNGSTVRKCAPIQ